MLEKYTLEYKFAVVEQRDNGSAWFAFFTRTIPLIEYIWTPYGCIQPMGINLLGNKEKIYEKNN